MYNNCRQLHDEHFGHRHSTPQSHILSAIAELLVSNVDGCEFCILIKIEMFWVFQTRLKLWLKLMEDVTKTKTKILDFQSTGLKLKLKSNTVLYNIYEGYSLQCIDTIGWAYACGNLWPSEGPLDNWARKWPLNNYSEVQVLRFPGRQISWVNEWLSMQFFSLG